MRNKKLLLFALAATMMMGTNSLVMADDKVPTVSTGTETEQASAQITFDEFTHTGVYEYTVNERQESFGGVTYADNEYTLRVYVANKANGGFYIQTIIAESEEGKEEKRCLENWNYFRMQSILKSIIMENYIMKENGTR